VSIGVGISKKHPDWPPIRSGIARAREQGGTAIWCHNNWGYEDVANWFDGRLDAQNIFDGGSHGGYAESFYPYLNAGLQVPFSTGTDWFMYDFSRCYARVRGELTPESWLASLRRGRTFITNGPVLDLRVNDCMPGETIDIASPAELRVEAVAKGRVNFGRLELVHTGRVVESVHTRPVDKHFEARMSTKLSIAAPGWLAVRVSTTQKNEYGAELFAHSSPIYITHQGRRVQLESDLRFLLGQVASARSEITAKARFDNESQRKDVLQIYDRAIGELETRLGNLKETR
jgi:hypothetical protein